MGLEKVFELINQDTEQAFVNSDGINGKDADFGERSDASYCCQQRIRDDHVRLSIMFNKLVHELPVHSTFYATLL